MYIDAYLCIFMYKYIKIPTFCLAYNKKESLYNLLLREMWFYDKYHNSLAFATCSFIAVI